MRSGLKSWSSLVRMRDAMVLALAVTSLCARGAPPNYDAFSDREGHIRDEHVVAAQAMVRDPEQLEIAYADAKKGNARAARVFQELETRFVPDIGREVAERTSSPGCLVPVYRELSGQCIPNWAGLDFLREESGAGRRLRKAVADAYAARARERGVKNQAILSAIGALLAGTVARSALAQAERAAGAGIPLAEARSALRVEPLRQAISISEARLAHVLARHSPGGAQAIGTSLFNAGESVPALVRAAESVAPVLQRGGRLQRIVEAGRAIGIDRATGLPTTIYTVITDTAGNLVTAFPGVP